MVTSGFQICEVTATNNDNGEMDKPEVRVSIHESKNDVMEYLEWVNFEELISLNITFIN